jgi:hypothetical protein
MSIEEESSTPDQPAPSRIVDLAVLIAFITCATALWAKGFIPLLDRLGLIAAALSLSGIVYWVCVAFSRKDDSRRFAGYWLAHGLMTGSALASFIVSDSTIWERMDSLDAFRLIILGAVSIALLRFCLVTALCVSVFTAHRLADRIDWRAPTAIGLCSILEIAWVVTSVL